MGRFEVLYVQPMRPNRPSDRLTTWNSEDSIFIFAILTAMVYFPFWGKNIFVRQNVLEVQSH